MERRSFLKAGAVATGTVGLGAVGCGAVLEGMSVVPVPSLAELQALDMDGFLKRLDTSLGFLQSSSSFSSVLSNKVVTDARKDPRFEKSEDTIRKTMRSLLLTGSFGDLPEAGRAHPGMQARLWNSMQEMDDAVLGMNKLMTSLTPTERADISRLMREDPTVAPRILDTLDQEGVKAGVSDKRRAHMREIGKHVCFRIRQSTSSFIDEYDDKVKKVAARDSSLEAVQRRLMAEMGESAFWEFHARQTALVQAWQQVPGLAQTAPPNAGPAPTGTSWGVGTATATGIGTATAMPPGTAPSATGTYVVYPYPPPGASGYPPVGMPVGSVILAGDTNYDDQGRNIAKLHKGTVLLGVGGGLLGLGAIAAGIGAVLVGKSDTSIAGAFVFTAAALLGLGGIGCLIAGGIIRGNA